MTVLCTTDFSPAAEQSALAAAAIAKSLGEPLLLAHASGLSAGASDRKSPLDRLSAEAAKLAGVQVDTALLDGPAAAALLEFVARVRPRLVVAAALGTGRRGTLGNVAEAIAQGTSRPLLLVRNAAPFLDWAAGKRPLRVVVGDDFSSFTAPAFRWLRDFTAAGPCAVTVAHLYSPVTEYGRAGLLGGDDPYPVEKRLEEDLQGRTRLYGLGDARVRVAPTYGRIADPLVALAAEEQADLLVLGTHQRPRLERAWYGSVSSLALRLAPMSVAAVPWDEERDAAPAAVPPVRRVLACTDFSPLGNLAIAHACSVLGSGGEVIALHVFSIWPPLPSGATAEDAAKLITADERTGALRRLQALVPGEAAARKIAFRAEVAAAAHVAATICGIAEAAGVDLICLTSHGRGGITRAVLGSVAGGVLAQSRRPVLVVRPRAG